MKVSPSVFSFKRYKKNKQNLFLQNKRRKK